MPDLVRVLWSFCSHLPELAQLGFDASFFERRTTAARPRLGGAHEPRWLRQRLLGNGREGFQLSFPPLAKANKRHFVGSGEFFVTIKAEERRRP